MARSAEYLITMSVDLPSEPAVSCPGSPPASPPTSPPACSDEVRRSLPWHVDAEQPRVLLDAHGRLLGVLDSPEAALLAAQAASAGDVDARCEVTRLHATMEHYRHRMQMSPSERQALLDESVQESIQPERHYGKVARKPVKDLLGVIADAGAAARLGESSPADALTRIEEAVAALHRDSRGWFSW